MLLTATRNNDGGLTLIAKTYLSEEVAALVATLRGIDVHRVLKRRIPSWIARDPRPEYRITLSPTEAERFTSLLHVQVSGTRRKPWIVVSTGRGYKCQEVTLRGNGKGCMNLTAASASEATTKCALVAQQHRWFGGVATPGTCASEKRDAP
jgi:hypothetical protein